MWRIYLSFVSPERYRMFTSSPPSLLVTTPEFIYSLAPCDSLIECGRIHRLWQEKALEEWKVYAGGSFSIYSSGYQSVVLGAAASLSPENSPEMQIIKQYPTYNRSFSPKTQQSSFEQTIQMILIHSQRWEPLVSCTLKQALWTFQNVWTIIWW
jgi:hypothetical protein